ncbi:MAG: hypothetical protein LBT27_01480 [Prevotellaceae bacterium]|nr:hypothetical protein [Prevotellaceae bacterium]
MKNKKLFVDFNYELRITKHEAHRLHRCYRFSQIKNKHNLIYIFKNRPNTNDQIPATKYQRPNTK